MNQANTTPPERLRVLWDHPLRADGDYVLYWMTATRRTSWNFALDRALELARELNKPLLVLEALRVDYPWASDRLHRFVLQGMADNSAALAERGIASYPYVEPEKGAGKGLLGALAERACAVVTDDSPIFFLPAMLASARLEVHGRLEAVDSCGLLPTRSATKPFARAYDFRRFLQRELAPHLTRWPAAAPLDQGEPLPKLRLPKQLTQRWPKAGAALLRGEAKELAKLPIDHSVPPGVLEGGSVVAGKQLERFLQERLGRYAEERNGMQADVTSELSAYLHFGQLSPHEVFARIVEREQWSPESLAEHASGKREGWWGMGADAEAYLDQLVTWRELGLNVAVHQPGYDRFESLPAWAQQTLAEHEDDERPSVYDLEAFEAAATHDELWNAAQNQLVNQGLMHGYLRMLWGKKILHWSRDPRSAHAIMLELNNKYALDGRDPNSHSGILWTLGKFDRAWGPERPVFGKVRYMTSENTRRKLKVGAYLQRFGALLGQG